MSSVLKYQVSISLAFQPFTTAPDTFRSAFELFFPLGFFPATIQEQLPGAAASERLSLMNNALGIHVQFLSNRIDFLYIPFASPSSALTLPKFVEQVRAVAAIAQSSKAIKVERIGLITDRMIDDIGTEKMDEIRKKFIYSPIDSFDNTSNIEWSARQVIRTPLSEDYKALCNQIYSVNRGTAQIGDPTGIRSFEALQISLDVNTHPIPSVLYSLDDINSFLDHAIIKHDSMLGNIESKIHGQ